MTKKRRKKSRTKVCFRIRSEEINCKSCKSWKEEEEAIAEDSEEKKIGKSEGERGAAVSQNKRPHKHAPIDFLNGPKILVVAEWHSGHFRH